jgi:hypothetical protein
MNIWAGPKNYVNCFFPHWETPTRPGQKLRPALVLKRFDTEQGEFLALVPETTQPSKNLTYFVDVGRSVCGMPLPKGGSGYLDLRKLMILSTTNRRIFPDGGKIAGSIFQCKYDDAVKRITVCGIRPRMRAVMTIAPLGLRERCAGILAEEAYAKGLDPAQTREEFIANIRAEMILGPGQKPTWRPEANKRAPLAAQHPPRPR